MQGLGFKATWIRNSAVVEKLTQAAKQNEALSLDCDEGSMKPTSSGRYSSKLLVLETCVSLSVDI